MKPSGSSTRSQPDPIEDRARPADGRNASIVPTVILFVAVISVAPLTFVLDRLLGGDWFVSALSAIAIAGVLAVNAFLLLRT